MPTMTVTKISSKRLNNRDFLLTINVVVLDDAVEVMNKDYTERYDNTDNIDTMRIKFGGKISADWDKYVAEVAILNAAAFDTMVTQIETTGNNYINP